MVTSKDGMNAAYALLGAPVWAAKKLGEMTSDLGDATKREFDEWVKEGEKLAKRLSDANMVDELSERMDLDQIQDQVEKLRDQLESVLGNWRDSFKAEAKPAAKKPAAAAKKPAAKKPATKTPAAKKPAAKKPAARKPAAKKTTTARKPAAKKPATAAKK